MKQNKYNIVKKQLFNIFVVEFASYDFQLLYHFLDILINNATQTSFYFCYVDLFDSEASAKSSSQMKMLYDHIPLRLNEDDYERVCQIPKEKVQLFVVLI